jgi:hypothetical protein
MVTCIAADNVTNASCAADNFYWDLSGMNLYHGRRVRHADLRCTCTSGKRKCCDLGAQITLNARDTPKSHSRRAYQMNHYVHSVPGRLRLKNPLFKNSTVHYDVKKALVNMGHGIGTAEFNTTTGSLLINYNPKEINHRDILATLERAGFYRPEKTITNDQVIHQATAKAYNAAVKAVSGAFIGSALEGTGLSFLSILL